MDEWLIHNLSPGSVVGLDPKYYGKVEWDALEASLGNRNITLSHVNHINLIDDVWLDRPDCPKDPVRELQIEFSGVSTYTKVQDIYDEMDREKAEVLIISELDEVACKAFSINFYSRISYALNLFERASESKRHRFAISSSF